MYIMGEEEVEAVRRVIESGQLFRYRGGEGGETDQFEQGWSKKIGVKHTIAMTSGTAALICGDGARAISRGRGARYRGGGRVADAGPRGF